MKSRKFRAWSPRKNKYIDGVLASSDDGVLMLNKDVDLWLDTDGEREDYAKAEDKNGVGIYFGDLLNIFWTSSEGEHIHDCVFQAVEGDLGDLQFKFIKLLWEDHGYNQYPLSQTLCLGYKTLVVYGDGLNIPDNWSENRLQAKRWKSDDQSNYFEVIGNIHENQELLK